MRKNSRKKEKGEIIMFVIFVVLFLMLFVSLFLSKILLRQARTADNVASTVQAYYLADSGTEYALYNLKNVCSTTDLDTSKHLPTCISNPPAFISGGDVDVSYDSATTAITVVGNFNGQTSRAIRVSWPSP